MRFIVSNSQFKSVNPVRQVITVRLSVLYELKGREHIGVFQVVNQVL